jgi:zona occludens toxin
MLFLRTGGNGSGKTAFTIKEVRELQLKENRPVAWNGRFRMLEPMHGFGWKRIEAKDWEAEPDGTIFLFDECHNDFPLRPASAPPPRYVAQLAEHRVRGFDFFLLTQHPMNIDAFVRRLVQAPGWHCHLKRAPAGGLVSHIRWDAVNPQCEKNGSGSTGEVSMQAIPKEVFTWYESATLHTAKSRIPKAVWMLGVCVLLVPLLGWIGARSLFHSTAPKGQEAAKTAPGSTQAGSLASGAPSAAKRTLTAAEALRDRTPRFEGLPESAPRYDELTKPVRVPLVVGCWDQAGQGGWCITQQGTRVALSPLQRHEFIENGRFVDFEPGPALGESPGRGSRSTERQTGGPEVAISHAP